MVSPTSVLAHSQTRNIQCARRSVARVPNEMSDARIRGDVTKALTLCFGSAGLHMLGKLGSAHNGSKAVSNGCDVYIGADCVSTHFPGVKASLGKACTCARSSFMSYPLLQKLVHETSWLN